MASSRSFAARPSCFISSLGISIKTFRPPSGVVETRAIEAMTVPMGVFF